MHFIHQQSGIYHCADDARYYVFLRWRDLTGRHRYQRVDFSTLAEAGCFLTGALSASVLGKEAEHYRFTSALPVAILKLLAPALNSRVYARI